MSFEIALSGIHALSHQLDTISSNIANSSTYGYKASRTNFASMYAGAQPTGVEVSSVTQTVGQNTGVVMTGRTLDAAVKGKGFFIVREQGGEPVYTRVGIFNVENGYFVDSAGRRVQGYAATEANQLGTVGDIKVAIGQIPAKASDRLSYAGNMSQEWAVLPSARFDPANNRSYNQAVLTPVYDSLGGQHTITQYFIKTNTNIVQVRLAVDGVLQEKPAPSLHFDTAGQLQRLSPPVVSWVPQGADPMNVSLDYSGTTQFAGESLAIVNDSNGYTAGAFTGVRLEQNGELTASYSNGVKQTVATLALADFSNENGLLPLSNTSWMRSAVSGAAMVSTPGRGMVGELIAGALEKSNVDLSDELMKLMATQHSYQANTKVIAAENQVMQALMQVV